MSSVKFVQWAGQNRPKHEIFMQLHKSVISKDGEIGIIMSAEGQCPPGQTWDAAMQKCVPAANAGTAPPVAAAPEAQTHIPPAGAPTGTAAPVAGEFNAKDVMKTLQELADIKKLITTLTEKADEDRKNNRMSFKTLVDEDKATKDSVTKLTTEIGNVKAMAASPAKIALTDDEKNVVAEAAVRNTSLRDIVEITA